MLTSKTVTNLFNGVSQQAPQLRLPSQGQEQINAYSSVVDGLQKRPGLYKTTVIGEAVPAKDVRTHLVDRGQQSYQIQVTDGEVKVYDANTGQSFPVREELNALNYFKSYDGTPISEAFEFLTLEDFTFVVNKTIRARIVPNPYFDGTSIDGVIRLNFSNFDGSDPTTRPGSFTFSINGQSLTIPFANNSQSGTYYEEEIVRLLNLDLGLYGLSSAVFVGTPGDVFVPPESRQPAGVLLTGLPNAPLDFFNLDDKVSFLYGNYKPGKDLFVYVKQGVQDQIYNLSINGELVTYSTPPGDQPAGFRTYTIAENLAAQIRDLENKSDLVDGVIVPHPFRYEAEVYGALILAKAFNKSDGKRAEITFDAGDTFNDQALFAYKNRVQTETDLPFKFNPGYIVQVGDIDGYYLEYKKDFANEIQFYTAGGTARGLAALTPRNRVTVGLEEGELEYVPPGASGIGSGSFFGPVNPFTGRPAIFNPVTKNPSFQAFESGEAGIYQETKRPYSISRIIKETMPHAVLRNNDGTFTVTPIEFDERVCGDDSLLPAPSFNGAKIKDIFFHRNRLGLLTESNVVMSRNNEYFNFWRTTAKEVLDTDPIDVLITNTRVSTCRYAQSFNRELVVFADSSQFVISANNLLSPKNVNVQPSTNYKISPLCKAESSGQDVYFVSDRGKHSALYQYFVSSDSVQSQAVEVSSHVPSYIENGLISMTHSSTESILAMLSKNERNTIYIYKYLFDGERKVQESVSKWIFQDSEIVSIAFSGSRLFITTNFNEELILGYIDTEIVREERPLLDYIETPQGLLVGNDYEFTAEIGLVVVDTVRGEELPFRFDGTKYRIDSGLFADEAGYFHGRVVFGRNYEMRYTMSPIYYRPGEAGGLEQYNYTLRRLVFNYKDTKSFQVFVRQLNRNNKYCYEFPKKSQDKRIITRFDRGDFVVGAPVDGVKSVIEIVNNTHKQSKIISVTIEGFAHVNNQRV